MATIGTSAIPIRIAAVDDDNDFCLSLKDILDSAQGFTFAGRFSNATDALAGVPQLNPDLVVMDIHLPDLNGIECASRLKRAMLGLKIVMLTGTHEAHWVDASSKAGAVAYLVKPFIPAQLIATLRSVALTVGEEIRAPLPTRQEQPVTITPESSLPLSSQQRDVLRNLAKGLLYKEIAGELGISETAVHKSQSRIFKKLGVSNRTEAVLLWLKNGGD